MQRDMSAYALRYALRVILPMRNHASLVRRLQVRALIHADIRAIRAAH